MLNNGDDSGFKNKFFSFGKKYTYTLIIENLEKWYSQKEKKWMST